ncbi:unnamed protein product, partial [Didymodactylos carnosus]
MSAIVHDIHIQTWSNPCDPNPCRAGKCELISKTNFTCHCAQYIYGPLCEKLNYEQKACDSNPCYNQALCTNTADNSYTCLCPPSHSGKHCKQNVGECDCLNGGTCQNVTSYDLLYRCQCPPLFTGSLCEYDLRNITFCSYSPCQHNGTCILIEAPAGICLCEPGYIGAFCEKRVPFCQENPCRNNGTCVPSGVDGQCICLPGNSGRVCERLVKTFCSSNP